MDNALYASMDVLDVVECNIPCVCKNASMSVNPHNCDDMLLESMGVVDIPNIKLLKKKTKKFNKDLSKLFCEKDDLLAKFNESNKLVEKYKKLAENSFEKLKEFELLNMDLDAKLVLSNKLVDELKCENESLKMHAKCLIAEPISKNDENICCNHVVVPNLVPILCSTSKDKLVYIPPHKRNQKVERNAIKSKPPLRSHIFINFLHPAFLYMHCFGFDLTFYASVFVCVKIQNHIKSEKFKKFDRIFLSTYHM